MAPGDITCRGQRCGAECAFWKAASETHRFRSVEAWDQAVQPLVRTGFATQMSALLPVASLPVPRGRSRVKRYVNVIVPDDVAVSDWLVVCVDAVVTAV